MDSPDVPRGQPTRGMDDSTVGLSGLYQFESPLSRNEMTARIPLRLPVRAAFSPAHIGLILIEDKTGGGTDALTRPSSWSTRTSHECCERYSEDSHFNACLLMETRVADASESSFLNMVAIVVRMEPDGKLRSRNSQGRQLFSSAYVTSVRSTEGESPSAFLRRRLHSHWGR